MCAPQLALAATMDGFLIAISIFVMRIAVDAFFTTFVAPVVAAAVIYLRSFPFKLSTGRKILFQHTRYTNCLTTALGFELAS